MKATNRTLRAGTMLAAAFTLAIGFAGTASADTTLTVWDWKNGDPVTADYYAAVKKDFEAAHPGVTVKYVMQPHDQYYTLLGTAISSGQGPDVVLLHGGSQAKERVSALTKLDDKVADIKGTVAGWDEFTGADGGLYAVPISIQGFAVYYNKDLFAKAGLDPEKTPKSWADLSATAEALKKAGVAPFALGNKEGFGADFFLSAVAANGWTKAQQDAWTKGDLKWSSPEVKAIVQAWVDTKGAGWYADGANSTAKFMDEYESFERGENAQTIGLISDVAHWKEFDEFLGADKVGVYVMPPIAGGDGSLKLPLAGGIGYGVTKFSPNQDLAADLVKSFADTDHMKIFFETAGAIPANTKVDTSDTKSPSAKVILAWLSDGVPLAHNNMSTAEVEEWHRQSQLLFTGETTVDKAVARLDDVQAQSKKK
ncbi:extracellular solute-binding protein [Kaistia dalseonensis]|uniref:ABC-type glycerol-3-phosphate transport system substrate-binding protein n=1 Tax=Kaistia dalseonensis TaxID=410840 RepID=A0ABU0HAS1_9HYPH|nr:extracellular solute-binding protein [Kaistia dalseonensis]MCX5496793.1 extracellular solute-binding protein [Kaistia dalseonensis]MDQ0439419.1 ABC-type glycerol-3-phosphate transport system substrate-binding protein [Kaistia dalseonensis]